jgi:DNA-binding beta-propeller fold protein YncE
MYLKWLQTKSCPLDRLVDENNKKNLAVDKKHQKMYIFDVIYKLNRLTIIDKKKNKRNGIN